ncbi:MAG: hypothetical protein IJD38_03755 [Clostridia bacterium]|nr:hypothetical protein [Clostridia bacterium]
MKNIRIPKTDRGFVLRQSISHLAEAILSFLLCVGLSIFFFVRAGSEANVETAVLGIVCGVFCLCTGVILLYFTAGQRMVLNDEGVRLYRLGIHTRSLPWGDIREWGTRFENNFAKDRLTKPFCYYFFFTTEAGIYGGKGYLFMEISKSDYKTLPRSVIRRYVKARLNTEGTE